LFSEKVKRSSFSTSDKVSSSSHKISISVSDLLDHDLNELLDIILSNLEQVLQLADEVESLFMKNFAGNDRMVAMKYLKPQQPRSTHMITFLVGT
jgi:hypothetical protein